MNTNEFSLWNVLIIDDEPHSIGVVEYICLFHNAKVRTATGGQNGLTLMREEKPNLIFLDIQMPNMSGLDVIQQIRADSALRDVTVIAITAHAMSGDKERFLDAGFDGYLPKPISPMTFVDEVQAIVNVRPHRRL